MDLEAVYRDLHAHPELSFQEHRTAGIVAGHLRALGLDVTEGVAGTGVVGMARRGDGPTVMLRADMDALPVTEDTGLPYASENPGVMHACGHDMHVTCLLGAVRALVADDTWRGTLMAVFQPAEEGAGGAAAMLADGLFERFGTPDVCLGQHVAPLPAGLLAYCPGVAFAASDSIRIVLHGRGGHGSRPETTVDPVLMAASLILRLQTIVSREVAATEAAVVTVGAVHAGTRGNIIPDDAELRLSVRSFDPGVRDRVHAAIGRLARAEAAAAGADREPEVVVDNSFPLTVNEPAATARVADGFRAAGLTVSEVGPASGSEDFRLFGAAAGVPSVYWLLGGGECDSNHSPRFAPKINPTLDAGVAALANSAKTFFFQITR
ncbi:amidohydrolase [Longispora sp. K20-0274]|uniref:amidohydrolase n=1 Tax=Longispora sp. K20-0274 TaxID=3088255 RepID=UPI00399B5177